MSGALRTRSRFWTMAASLLWLFMLAGVPAPGWAGSQADAAPAQSYLVGEYKLPPSIDPTVADGVTTELWAAVYRPQASGRYPLVVFLHGNHGTCGYFDQELGIRVDDEFEYTDSGTCPAGYVPTPNHLGYGYLAGELASRGYVVVSINANRGVNIAAGVRGDPGLNLRRGRLVLRHLQQLAEWNAGRAPEPASLGFSLRDLIDFDHVGLMGHSRGGEGMRAALAQYRDRKSIWPQRIGKVNFEAVFEIAPVDGQTRRTLDADAVAWNVLLPACDGDVSDLQGIKPFDRMITRRAEAVALPKSSLQVFGVNHNFYNTEWQLSDSVECLGQPKLFPEYVGSEMQRQTALQTVVPFFQAHLGGAKQSALAERFDPTRPVPPELDSVTFYARGHVASLLRSSIFVIDDFTRKTGKSSRDASNIAYRLAGYQHGSAGFSHDRKLRAARIAWSDPTSYFQVNASNRLVSIPPGLYNSLEFRVKLECDDQLCSEEGGDVDQAGDVDFSIRLVTGNGNVSAPVMLSSVASVHRPVASDMADGWNSVFQTVRIPLASFAGADMSRFRGVRFSFDASPKGRISLANVRLVQAEARTPPTVARPLVAFADRTVTRPQTLPPERNEVVAVRHGAMAEIADIGVASGDAARMTEIEVRSTRPFPISDALPTLLVGNKAYTISRFANERLDRLIFSIEEREYRQLPPSADLKLVIGARPVWNFGTFVKR